MASVKSRKIRKKGRRKESRGKREDEDRRMKNWEDEDKEIGRESGLPCRVGRGLHLPLEIQMAAKEGMDSGTMK
jgi:hypothetical protein